MTTVVTTTTIELLLVRKRDLVPRPGVTLWVLPNPSIVQETDCAALKRGSTSGTLTRASTRDSYSCTRLSGH